MLGLCLNLKQLQMYFVALMLDLDLELAEFGRHYACLGEKCLPPFCPPLGAPLKSAARQARLFGVVSSFG